MAAAADARRGHRPSGWMLPLAVEPQPTSDFAAPDPCYDINRQLLGSKAFDGEFFQACKTFDLINQRQHAEMRGDIQRPLVICGGVEKPVRARSADFRLRMVRKERPNFLRLCQRPLNGITKNYFFLRAQSRTSAAMAPDERILAWRLPRPLLTNFKTRSRIIPQTCTWLVLTPGVCSHLACALAWL